MTEEPISPDEEKSSLNMEVNLASAFAYALACVSGITLFVLETKSKKVRFHALQSALVFGILFLVNFGLIFLTFMTTLPFFLISNIVWMAGFILWLILVIRTYQGATIVLPVIGNFAREQVGWPPK